MTSPAVDIHSLTAEQKLELIDRLWESLGPDDLELTSEQRTELDRRLDRLDSGELQEHAWEDVRNEMSREDR
ncbi:MAG: addiction module protein [Deltaproteobacteria bacterium]|nr:addiction module protein [Nannocystaceae bacterium]